MAEEKSRSPAGGALSRCVAAGKTLVNVVRETGVRFARSDCFRLASSLSFQSLVSIVPALLFLLWSFQLVYPDFGIAKITDLMRPYFFPEMLEDVTQTIAEIIGRINFAALGWIGAALAFFATFSLVFNFKGALDRIFKIKDIKPSQLRRLIIVVTTVIVFPLYIWLIFRETRLWFHVPSVLAIARPYGITILTLFLLYRLLPEQPPRTWSALIGSLLAGVFLEMERMSLAMYFSYMKGVYSIIYGALFLLPLFLVWLYFAWVIILAGATLTSVIEKLLKQRNRESRLL